MCKKMEILYQNIFCIFHKSVFVAVSDFEIIPKQFIISWSCRTRRSSSADWLQGSRVWTMQRARIFSSCVCFIDKRPLRRTGHSFRGVVPVACVCVWSRNLEVGGLRPEVGSAPQKEDLDEESQGKHDTQKCIRTHGRNIQSFRGPNRLIPCSNCIYRILRMRGFNTELNP